jgi:hypothetical protein
MTLFSFGRGREISVLYRRRLAVSQLKYGDFQSDVSLLKNTNRNMNKRSASPSSRIVPDPSTLSTSQIL